MIFKVSFLIHESSFDLDWSTVERTSLRWAIDRFDFESAGSNVPVVAPALKGAKQKRFHIQTWQYVEDEVKEFKESKLAKARFAAGKDYGLTLLKDMLFIMEKKEEKEVNFDDIDSSLAVNKQSFMKHLESQ